MNSLAPCIYAFRHADCPEASQGSLCRSALDVMLGLVVRTGVLAGLSIVLLGGASPVLAEANAPVEEGARVSEVTLSGVTYVKSEGGVSHVLLRADEAEFDITANRVQLHGMSVETKSDVGNKEFWLRCDRGVIDLNSGDFQGEGNVKGEMADGRRFETQSAQYDDKRALISGDVPVLLTEVSGTLRGGGFQYWVREDRLQLTKAQLLQDPNDSAESDTSDTQSQGGASK